MLPTEQISHQVYLVGSRNAAKKITSSHNREQHTTVKYSTFYCLLSTFGVCVRIQADYSVKQDTKEKYSKTHYRMKSVIRYYELTRLNVYVNETNKSKYFILGGTQHGKKHHYRTFKGNHIKS